MWSRYNARSLMLILSFIIIRFILCKTASIVHSDGTTAFGHVSPISNIVTFEQQGGRMITAVTIATACGTKMNVHLWAQPNDIAELCSKFGIYSPHHPQYQDPIHYQQNQYSSVYQPQQTLYGAPQGAEEMHHLREIKHSLEQERQQLLDAIAYQKQLADECERASELQATSPRDAEFEHSKEDSVDNILPPHQVETDRMIQSITETSDRLRQIERTFKQILSGQENVGDVDTADANFVGLEDIFKGVTGRKSIPEPAAELRKMKEIFATVQPGDDALFQSEVVPIFRSLFQMLNRHWIVHTLGGCILSLERLGQGAGGQHMMDLPIEQQIERIETELRHIMDTIAKEWNDERDGTINIVPIWKERYDRIEASWEQLGRYKQNPSMEIGGAIALLQQVHKEIAEEAGHHVQEWEGL